jgi:hypothetical protein
VTVAESPLAVSAAPENDGVALFVDDPIAGAVTVTTGGGVSIVNVTGGLKLGVPATSCSAWTVYWPSGPSGADGKALQLPPTLVVLSVCTGVPAVLDPR